MKTLLAISLLLVLVGCQTSKQKQEEREDRDDWVGQRVSTVESHPVFSKLPSRERHLSHGERMLSYRERSKKVGEPLHCIELTLQDETPVNQHYCSAHELDEQSCTYQFLIKNHKIKDYRVLGENCFTSCEYRPHGCHAYQEEEKSWEDEGDDYDRPHYEHHHYKKHEDKNSDEEYYYYYSDDEQE